MAGNDVILILYWSNALNIKDMRMNMTLQALNISPPMFKGMSTRWHACNGAIGGKEMF